MNFMKKKISLNENLELLFEMDQKIFTREFDSKFESMEQVESYYYGSEIYLCLLYTSPSPRDRTRSRMPSSA